MKLNRVSLQGFLAHYGREIDGVIAPIDLDFTESNLWLMHGANGSGKSSVFDAITFALFDKARGGQLAKLVNDRSTAARVEVELESGGVRYLVKRVLKLKKNRDGHSQSSGDVLRWNEAENRWAEEENVVKIRDWAERTFQVSYDNFVSSVVLEQGRADRFLSATPRERREQLMKLLDLSVYEKISEVANARRNLSRAELKSKENQLQNCTAVSSEDLASAAQFATDAQTRVSELGEAVKRADKMCGDAQRAADWATQIEEKTARQTGDAAILLDAQIIENAVREHDELNAILPALRSIGTARRALSDAETELKSAHAETLKVHDRALELAPIVEQLRAKNARAIDNLTQAQLRATRLELDGARAQDDADKLKQIEALETEIDSCERALKPHREWLNRAESIEARREKIENLNQIIGVVRPVFVASQKLARAQENAQKALKVHDGTIEDARAADQILKNARERKRELEGADENLKQQRAKLAAKLELNRETLRARDELGHADECPTCGSALDEGSDTSERIAHEREMLRREIANWQARLDEIERELRDLNADKKSRAQAEEIARESFDKSNKIAAKNEAQFEFEKRELEERERDLVEASQHAGEWKNEDLTALETQLATLNPATIGGDWRALQDAQKAARETEATARAARAQLAHLPNWDSEKRRDIGELQRDLQNFLASASAALKAAKEDAESAQNHQDNAQNDWTEAQSEAKIAAGLEAQKLDVKRKAEAELAAQSGQIEERWRAHLAAHNDDDLEHLNARFSELKAVVARATELDEARRRVRDLESAIEVLRAQIATIPPEHRVEVAHAQIALQRAQNDLASAETERDEARDDYFKLSQAHETFARCESERNAAALEANRDQELAEALGRDGLQARIIKRAQEDLRGAANGILGRLSKGQWQIDLREQGDNEKGKELEIIARDLARGGAQRTFDALSGGERFRVAISLAIAIGQMAANGAPMNTLVIDEGFGALDEENRGLMVDNLRHLSEHELKNGRIIVVSHQNDVQDFFGHRYQLSRDSKGYAHVEMTVG